MARKKIAGTIIQSHEDAALHLKEIGELENQIALIEANLDARVSDLRLEAELKADSIKDHIKRMEHELRAFVIQHKIEFEKERTRACTFGSYGFRKSTKITIPDPGSTIAMLHAKLMTDCLIVTEKIDRDKLKQCSEDILADVGATKKSSDTFWYEVKHEKLGEA